MYAQCIVQAYYKITVTKYYRILKINVKQCLVLMLSRRQYQKNLPKRVTFQKKAKSVGFEASKK